MNQSGEKNKVLFICTHNAVRSQMAEGLMNALLGARYEAKSAGTIATGVNPLAIRVMQEISIDISHQRSNSVREFGAQEFDAVVTVCDSAREACPFFPDAKHTIHQGFEDPATFEGSEEEILEKFRSIRDEIKDWILATFHEE